MNLYHLALIITLTSILSSALGQANATTTRPAAQVTEVTHTHSTTTAHLTAATVAALQTEDDWTDFWTTLGAGAPVDITTTVPLSREVQQTAKAALGQALLLDTMSSNAAARTDEKLYVNVMHFILSDKELYVLGYLDLANHALARNPVIGRVMYKYVPYEEEAWEQLPDQTKLKVLYHKRLFDRSRDRAVKMQENDSITTHTREFAMAMELASVLCLGDISICEKALAVEPESLHNEEARQLILSVHQACKRTE